MKILNNVSCLMVFITVLFLITSVSAADTYDNLDNNLGSNVTSYDSIQMDDEISDSKSSNVVLENLENNNAVVEQNMSVEGNSNYISYVQNVNVSSSDLNDSLINITQTSDNLFDVSITNQTLHVCSLRVTDLKTFNEVRDFIARNDLPYDALVVEFVPNFELNFVNSPIFKENMGGIFKLGNVKRLIIRGNGAKLYVDDPSFKDLSSIKSIGKDAVNGNDYFNCPLFNIPKESTIVLDNIKIVGFVKPFVNKGNAILNNVVFDKNYGAERPVKKLDGGTLNKESEKYWKASAFLTNGGAIENHGDMKCVNCVFSNNKANFGGAIFNAKGSNCVVIDSEFYNNYASCVYVNLPYRYVPKNGGPGDKEFNSNDLANICTEDSAFCTVYSSGVTNKHILLNIKNRDDFNNALFIVKNLGENIRNLVVLNISKGEYVFYNYEGISLTHVENLFINGNGAVFKISAPKDSEENHFLNLLSRHNCIVSNVTIMGFNKAIINAGSLSLYNVTFIGNKCDYWFKEDYGGSIYNEPTGLINMVGCKFSNGYAKKGGAIYNENGNIFCSGCYFESNQAYGDGGVCYNDKGNVNFNNCVFNNNRAKNGGAIFSSYNRVNVKNSVFFNNKAEKLGHMIYDDKGHGDFINNTCINQDVANSIYVFGEDANINVNNSHMVRYIDAGDLHFAFDVDSNPLMIHEGPDEFSVSYLRVAEITLSILIGTTIAYACPPALAFGVSLVSGVFMAFGEELIEEVYFEHNLNYGNLIAMAGISGLFDLVPVAFAKGITKPILKKIVADEARRALISVASCFVVEVGSEILTEYLPRLDFNNYTATKITNVSNDDDMSYSEDGPMNSSPMKFSTLNIMLLNNNNKDVKINLTRDVVVDSTIFIEGKNVIIDGQGHSFSFNKNTLLLGNLPVHSAANFVFKNIIFKANSLNNCRILDNQNYQTKVFFENCTFSHFQSANHIFHTNGLLRFDNVTFFDNGVKGGSVIFAEGIEDVIINSCVFDSNSALDADGMIHAVSIVVKNSIFDNNMATNGGAIYATYVDVVNSIFDNNRATNNGGAISCEAVGVVNSTFINNRANKNGGAICAHSHFTSNDYVGNVNVANSTFINNWAKCNGGAIYAGNLLTFDYGNPSFFIGNIAYEDKGGAIYTNYIDHVKYVAFVNNRAGEGGIFSDDGGAIYINEKNTVFFEHCIFINNHCTDEGGAIYFDSCDSHLRLNNNFFAGNSADEGQDVFNKGKYDLISFNYWSKNPSSSNDQLVQYVNPFKQALDVVGSWFTGKRDFTNPSDKNPLKYSLDWSCVKTGDSSKIFGLVSIIFSWWVSK